MNVSQELLDISSFLFLGRVQVEVHLGLSTCLNMKAIQYTVARTPDTNVTTFSSQDTDSTLAKFRRRLVVIVRTRLHCKVMTKSISRDHVQPLSHNIFFVELSHKMY